MAGLQICVLPRDLSWPDAPGNAHEHVVRTLEERAGPHGSLQAGAWPPQRGIRRRFPAAAWAAV